MLLKETETLTSGDMRQSVASLTPQQYNEQTMQDGRTKDNKPGILDNFDQRRKMRFYRYFGSWYVLETYIDILNPS